MTTHVTRKHRNPRIGIFLALGLLLTGEISAAEPVAPLGFTIGQASRQAVIDGLNGRTKLVPNGTNRYSGGAMLKAPGDNLGIENLQTVQFIFDTKDVLVCTQMQMHKGAMDANFEAVYQRLAAKYKVVTKQIPFVGDKYVRFRQGDVVIDLEAPHMSFTMTVTYMTTGFVRAYETASRREAEEKERNERRQF